MARFCATCGTEVDETAVFCPTCGQPIDQEAETQLPPAPAWPDPDPVPGPPTADPATPVPPPASAGAVGEPRGVLAGEDRDVPVDPPRRALTGLRGDSRELAGDEPVASVQRAAPSPAPAARSTWDEPTRIEDRAPRQDNFDDSTAPPPPAPVGGTVPPPPRREPARSPAVNLPITTPVTLSAWLIGVGAAIGAIGALISLFDGFGAAVDLVVFVALAAVGLTVFFSSSVPAFPHLRLVTLAVVLVAFGVGLDRLGFAGAGGVGELLLFLGSAAAVIGALLLELGRDQPLGGPQR